MKRKALMWFFAGLLVASTSFATAGNSSDSDPTMTTFDSVVQWLLCIVGDEESCSSVSNNPIIINR